MSENKNDKKDITSLLGDSVKKPVYKRLSTWLILAILAGGAYGGWTWYQDSKSSKVSYVTAKAEKGNLSVEVSANGTIQPVRTVSIGSELSGIVRNVAVDVNDHVKAGEVLIELDDTKLKASVERAKANLELSKAALAEAKATLKEAQAKLARLNEVRRLSGGKSPSKTEIDSQVAIVARAEASVQSAEAKIIDSEEALKSAQSDLSKTQIKSPIDGIVLTRKVENGYAVAASLQAVELLTIATDMKDLELQVNVDEADVGVVKPGQRAYFTVSAYPDKKFPADITKVAFGSTKTDNVVTYVTYLSVKNPDLMLRPGMTATANIQTVAIKDGLLVPNTALRFKPVTKTENKAPTMSMFGPPMHNRKQKTAGTVSSSSVTSKPATVYVIKNGEPTELPLTIGVSDGKVTQVLEGDLKPGQEIIIDQRRGA